MAIYYIGMLLGVFNMIVLLPKVLSPVNFGILRLLFPFASILTLFSLLGVSNIIVRFFPLFNDEKRAYGSLLTLGLLIAGAGLFIFTILFFIFQPFILDLYDNNSPEFIPYYNFIFPMAVGMTLYEVFNAYCRAQLRTVYPNLINEVYVRLAVVVITVFYIIKLLDFQAFLVCFVSIYLSVGIILMFYLKNQNELILARDKRVFNKLTLREIGKYGVFNFMGGAAGSLVDKIDILFIGYIGVVEAAVYSIAIQLTIAISFPAKGLMLILFPITADAFKNNDMVKVKKMYASSSDNQLLLGSIVFLLIWINFDSFFSLIHPEFLKGKEVFLFLGMARVFDMATGINGTIIINSKYYKYDLLFTSLLVGLTIVTNYYLIPIYGMVGGAIATALSIVIYNIIKYFFVWTKLKMQPFTYQTLRIVLVLAIITIISQLLPRIPNPYLDILYKTAITGGLSLAGIMF
ncbi:MAG: oligosaccharide flippase family protein, partial [Bacteroidota bacterium]|nr:oligosaccharide flippase family protein [Bacteroidota bacterium]